MKKCISNLTANKIYSVDTDLFERKYLTDHFDDLDDMVSEMMGKIAEIDGDQQAAADYRRSRKASRGRWVGGGFGMSGAVRGAMEAGLMNTASGIGHSAFNALGNIGSSIAASSERSKVYSYYKSELSECSKCTVLCVQFAFMEAMHKEGGFQFKTISDDDSSRAKAMMNNLSSIPKNQQLPYLLQVLELDPYNASVYKKIWTDYGDANGELQEMSDDFNTGLSAHIKSICDEFADDNDTRYCDKYNRCNNPRLAAVKYEADVRNAMDKLKAFCDLHTIEYNNIKYYKKYSNALTLADRLNRTVDGKTYETHEEAKAVREDISLFYEHFKECDISDKDAVAKHMRSLEYRSEDFKASLNGRIENEIVLRTPELLFENLKRLVTDLKYPEAIHNGIEIERIHQGIRTKLPAIRTYGGVGLEETPLIFIERGCGILGTKGNAKSGFVITNRNIKIYSSAMMSKEKKSFDLMSIKEVECLGNCVYNLVFSQLPEHAGTTYEFTLDIDNLSLDGQNLLSELLTKIIFTIQNIDNKKLLQIERIYKKSALCACGTYLLPNELCCPKCHRFLQSDGSFAESIVCPVCQKHLKPLSKFCTTCGHSFEDMQENDMQENDMQAESQASPLTEEILIECNGCHQKISANKKFCQYCGQSISKSNADTQNHGSTELTCKKCGNKITVGKNFCNKCGTKIKI